MRPTSRFSLMISVNTAVRRSPTALSNPTSQVRAAAMAPSRLQQMTKPASTVSRPNPVSIA